MIESAIVWWLVLVVAGWFHGKDTPTEYRVLWSLALFPAAVTAGIAAIIYVVMHVTSVLVYLLALGVSI